MFRDLPIATRSLIILNVGIFILLALLSSLEIFDLQYFLGSYFPSSPFFHFWQPFTHLFIHAGISHLLFNMFALFMFGATIERIIGTQKFLVLYFVAGMGSFILFNIQSYFTINQLTAELYALDSPAVVNQVLLEVQNNLKMDHLGVITGPGYIDRIPELSALVGEYIRPMMGASGAIYGVLIAFGMLYPNAGLIFFFIPFPIKAKYFIPGIILLEVILGLLNLSWNPIAHFAHLGGAAAGFLLIWYWKKQGAIRL
ncbi:rhomboid family intramembrane serine protease [Ignatzschineria indica]|uniref:Rhomboid family intramembrane serine protease n=1 Tax=Ignatzschineria indica TaxID=472583 RepID=A0A2U2AHW8_9GAMM|nr:rhomboid family intramembrane serine protease [Ignatzschineria indica]PWD82243.1 rhomboid family intramembrane serine protease [Ignatzschineria indica]GGZ87815.1 rhomboid family intramembrane serine protease [Ignatzschineria indica]